MSIDVLFRKAWLASTALLFLCCFPAASYSALELDLELDGSCEQINKSVEASRAGIPSLKDSLLAYSYRGLINGQVTIYNQALSLAGYDKFLPPKDVKKKSSYFLGKILGKCKKIRSRPKQYYDMANTIIAEEIINLYQSDHMKVDFNSLLNLKKNSMPPEYGEIAIGLGKDTCETFHKVTKEKPFLKGIYSSWVAGYLTPFMLIQGLEPKESVAMLNDVYNRTVDYCKSQPRVLYTEAVRQVLASIRSQ